MIINFLDTLIGPLPNYYTSSGGSSYYTEYYSIIRYIIAGMILIMMVSLVYRLFVAIFGRWIR